MNKALIIRYKKAKITILLNKIKHYGNIKLQGHKNS